VYEVGLVRGYQRVHPALVGEMVAFSGVARAARRDDVGPVVIASTRERNEVISRQALPVPKISLSPMAVLAAVAIASEEECVGDLAAEAAGNVDELDEPYYRWFGKCQPFASDVIATVRLDDLRLALDYESESAPQRDHCKWLEGGVQCQTPHGHSPNRDQWKTHGPRPSRRGPGTPVARTMPRPRTYVNPVSRGRYRNRPNLRGQGNLRLAREARKSQLPITN